VPSAKYVFPTNYKILGLSISQGQDLIQISRQTYDLLKCLGDVGGLQTCLQAFGMLLVTWYSAIYSSMKMISHLFATRTPFTKMQLTSNHLTNTAANQLNHMILDFSSRQKITFNCATVLGTLFRRRLRKRGEKKLEKELDIVKMIRHQR
jgi:hypothetical protein